MNFFGIFIQKDISVRDYDKFVDTGKVSDAILERIAKKVMKNETLEEREMTVFVSMTSDINAIILKFHKS